MLACLRCVGKTVLFNDFEDLAEGQGYLHGYVEVSEDGPLAPLLAWALQRVLLVMDAKKCIGDAVRWALGVLKAFSLRLPDGPEFPIDVDVVPGPVDSGEPATDLAVCSSRP